MSKYENKEGKSINIFLCVKGFGGMLPQEILHFKLPKIASGANLRHEFHARCCTVLPQTAYFQN